MADLRTLLGDVAARASDYRAGIADAAVFPPSWRSRPPGGARTPPDPSTTSTAVTSGVTSTPRH